MPCISHLNGLFEVQRSDGVRLVHEKSKKVRISLAPEIFEAFVTDDHSTRGKEDLAKHETAQGEIVQVHKRGTRTQNQVQYLVGHL